mgnify:CR=1 FL=1
MERTAKPIRENRTITVDFHDETTYFALVGTAQAFIEFVLAFMLAIGFQLIHKADCMQQGWPSDTPLPLCPCPPMRSDHLASPVHHVQSGVHRLAPFRPALPHDAT